MLLKLFSATKIKKYEGKISEIKKAKKT